MDIHSTGCIGQGDDGGRHLYLGCGQNGWRFEKSMETSVGAITEKGVIGKISDGYETSC